MMPTAIEFQALYFGYKDYYYGIFAEGSRGDLLGLDLYAIPGFPWSIDLVDAGLLKNGKHPEVEDGQVFWTCGGRPDLWIAFFWWDRSADNRWSANSGFYVRGFDLERRKEAFDYACSVFPEIVARQKHRLVLQIEHPRAVKPKARMFRIQDD